MFTSARYADPENKRIIATDERDREWWLETENDANNWKEYIDKGGVISPFVPPPPPDLPAIDTAELNAALLADGSVMRALGMVMFVEINKLRVKTGDTPYTLNQFKNALIAQMRN